MTTGIRLASFAMVSLLLLGCATGQPRKVSSRVPFGAYDGPTSCRRVISVFDDDIRQRHDPAIPMHERGRGRCGGRGR